jgi:hypothetical protein
MDFVDGMDGMDIVWTSSLREKGVGDDYCQAWRVQEAEELSGGAVVL